eukprot:Nk52_evm1s1524 gene=Nk52_evmTU1s1524
MEMKFEVCIDSVASAMNAQEGGASRVELCANLLEGGTTPSAGMLRVIKTRCPELPVYVMIRPRGGDFLYSAAEKEVMRADIEVLKQEGADGIVVGLLTKEGRVDVEGTAEMVGLARPLPVTFHRAFDMVSCSYQEGLRDLMRLGVERVLTSGLDATALEGLPTLKGMVRMCREEKSSLIVVPAGGINDRNLQRILDGCGATEFHASARSAVPSDMTFQKGFVSMGGALKPPEFSQSIANKGKVSRLMGLARDVPPSV